MSGTSVLRPPVKWHGGKFYLAKKIIECFPKHHTYVEPFGGGASVLLNKPASAVEIYNDLDGRITRLFRVLREHPQEFLRRMSLTPYSEVEFRAASIPSTDEVEQACRDFVRWRMSVGGRGESFSFTKHRVRRGMADVVSGYLSTIDEVLPCIVERLRSVQIMQRPALELIREWDTPETLFYCDPPYVHSTRASPEVYEFEMSDADHRQLLDGLNACRGLVVLSGYDCPLYRDVLRGWRALSFDIAKPCRRRANQGAKN